MATNAKTRVNTMIRISPVRLITEDGEQHGIVPLDQAQEAAEAAGLDLVEVAPNARPPVVRVMDWGKFQFEQQKRARESRKKQHTVDVKEVKLRPRTDEHDLEFKLRNARRFLARGMTVKVTVRFRGPELRRPETGQQVLDTVAEELAEVAHVESRSRVLEGRQLTMMLAPTG
ncbi:MAG TPA: translation initiation factor IF-3 [Longimicrobiales bacterium]|nr:translation initiation factor IF-3 [Longimicrobiales bacterium]